MVKSFYCSVALMVCMLPAMTSAHAEKFTGKVVEIIDGDTFVVANGSQLETVHLRGIDCPEPAQPFGPESKKYTSDLVMGKNVTVNTLGDAVDKKTPAKVTLEDGANLGERLLADGMAWYNDYEDPGNTVAQAIAAKAINAKKGLWSKPTPLAPWDFRGDKRIAPVVADKPTIDADEPEPDAKQIVYISENSTEYHKAGCEKLDKTKKPISLKEAKKLKYTPCPMCFPPKKDVKAPVIAAKGDYPDMPKINFQKFKDDPLYQQINPTWQTDANGKVTGITADFNAIVKAYPLAALLGFQQGDVLQSVNGQTINSEASIEQMVNKLKGVSSVSVGIMRGGTPQTITIPIPKF